MGTALMTSKRDKKDNAGMDIAKAIIDRYDPKNPEDMQDAIKDISGPMFEAMLQGEMDAHLGHGTDDHSRKDTTNRRNGYSHKNIKTAYGDIPIDVPRDRKATFTPQVVPKRTRDVSGIEDKVLSMYAKGMSQRYIADTIEDIYGSEISHEAVSSITDRVMAQADEWQDRPLKEFYTSLSVDCLYVPIRQEMETKDCAVYVILGYDVNGVKDILGIWISETEGEHYWMQVFDEIRARGVEDVLFISMDGVSGLGEGARSIFKDVVVQRCIVHLVRDWQHVEQLFNYGSAVRKVMYTTNAIEAVNSSFRKVIKKGSFPNEDAVRKVLYLRTTELYKKWSGRPIANWAFVRDQLAMDDKLQARILRYEGY